MSTRRTYGTGSKRELRPGLWELRADAGTDPISGKRRPVHRRFEGNENQAERALAQLVSECRSKKHDGTRGTLDALLADYFDFLATNKARSANTVTTYRRYARKNISPVLGKVPLVRLTTKDLDNLYTRLLAKGLAPATVRQHHAILQGALGQAMKWGHIATNPAIGATPPPARQATISPPSPAEVQLLIIVSALRDKGFGAFVLLAAVTGARRGELASLRWSHLDLEAGTVTIHATKTRRTRRPALDPFTVNVLAQHMADQQAHAAACEVDLDPDPWLFSRRADCSTPPHPDYFTDEWGQVRRAAGLPKVRLHDLRHYVATQLIGSGQDPRSVAGRLGHIDPSMTLRTYSHVLDEKDRQSADTLGALVRGSATGGTASS